MSDATLLPTDPRDYSVEATVAHAHRQSIIAAKRKAEAQFLVIGRHLYGLKQDDLWRALGHESFDELLADPEINLKRSTAYAMIRIWRVFGLPNEVPTDVLQQIGVDKLDVIAGPFEKAEPERAADLLSKAVTLAKSDLQDVVRPLAGGGPLTTEEQEAVKDRELAALVVRTLDGARVEQVVHFDRFRGLSLILKTKLGRASLRVWSHRGVSADVVELLEEVGDAER
jgi:hypothetical protein